VIIVKFKNSQGVYKQMKTIIRLALALSLVSAAYAADDVVSAVHGTVDKIGSAGKVVIVKTADGTKYSMHLVKTTVVHGADASVVATKGSWRGIAEGTEVVAHYTKRGAVITAVEIDRIGKGGLEVTKGTIMAISRGGKTLAVKTGDGTVRTFQLTGRAAKYAGTGIAKGSEKGVDVVVYSTKAAGKGVAHFFEAA
jgi:hypothetical protein